MRSFAFIFLILAIATLGLPWLPFFSGLQTVFWPIGMGCVLGAWACFNAARRYGAIA